MSLTRPFLVLLSSTGYGARDGAHLLKRCNSQHEALCSAARNAADQERSYRARGISVRVKIDRSGYTLIDDFGRTMARVWITQRAELELFFKGPGANRPQTLDGLVKWILGEGVPDDESVS